jgi:hypothetical protein
MEHSARQWQYFGDPQTAAKIVTASAPAMGAPWGKVSQYTMIASSGVVSNTTI